MKAKILLEKDNKPDYVLVKKNCIFENKFQL